MCSSLPVKKNVPGLSLFRVRGKNDVLHKAIVTVKTELFLHHSYTLFSEDIYY